MTILVAAIVVFVVAAAKVTNLKVFGVDTENVDVQFMYELWVFDILANNMIDIVIGAVDAGFLALANITDPLAEVSVENNEENTNN